MQGEFRRCGFEPGIHTLAPNPVTVATLHQCFSNGGGDMPLILDCGEALAIQCTIRSFSGRIELRNLAAPADRVSIDLDSGHVTIAESCTAGTVEVRGVGRVTDNSAGTTVITEGIVGRRSMAELLFDRDVTLVENRLVKRMTAGGYPVRTDYDANGTPAHQEIEQ
jgi:hypothetical protein